MRFVGMARNQQIMKFPTLNDRGGDLSKAWYVEWFYRVPGELKPRYGRSSKGMCSGSAEERRKAAQTVILDITHQLKAPDLLKARPEDITPVHVRDTLTRPEADRYAAFLAANDCKLLAKEYITWKKNRIRKSTYHTYSSKVKIFTDWLQEKRPLQLPANMQHQDIVCFFDWLTGERKLSKESIKRYRQALHDYYEWLRKEKQIIKENPVHDLPNNGKDVDYAAEPITRKDIKLLKEAIMKRDPYLWLQCLLQYYCAIRPGHEIRLMKIKDIDLEKLQVTIPGENSKNHKKAVLSINKQIAELIQDLGIMRYDSELYVFTAQNRPGSKPVGEHTMKCRFNQIRDQLHISKSVKFYSWKHTGAISMVENGVDLWKLQQHMRHQSIVTTEHYIKKRTARDRDAQNFIDEI